VTRRVGEWHLLGHEADPVPASQWDVEVVEREMRERARDAGDMWAVLRRLAALDGWRGQAAESFAERADEVLGDLEQVENRYDAVASALADWGADVSDARDRTWKALQAAESAQQTIAANPAHQGDGEPPADQDARDGRRTDAEEALGSARTAMHAAMQAFEDAAERAKGEIDDAADIWDDGWFGDFKGWVRANAELIYSIVQVLEVVAVVLGAILLVVAIVASAPFALIAAAIAASALLTLGQTLLAAADTGKAGWGDVAWSIAGLVVTLVGGRAAVTAVKGVKTVVLSRSTQVGGEARAAALTRLVGGNRSQFQNALKITDPQNGLARWAQSLRHAADAEGAAAARQFLIETRNLRPTRMQLVASLDRDVARAHLSLERLNTRAIATDELAKMVDLFWRARLASGANWAGAASLVQGVPGAVEGATKLVTNPPWSTQPVT
jgi:hypothetical protein